jgi:hypothetical protein
MAAFFAFLHHVAAFAPVAAVALALSPVRAHAGDAEITETLNVVWEVFWQQQGYMQSISKWREPIRVSVSGTSAARHRPFVLAELRRVARSAGIDLAEADGSGAPANLEVEIVPDDLTRVGFYFACRTARTPFVGVIRRVKITAEERSLRRCFLHETMHAMGMAGHPRGGSILSYYRGSSELTPTDEFMLKVWYSDEVMPGMYPLPALSIFARQLVESVPEGETRLAAERTAAQFQRQALAQLESIALGKGEPPQIVFQSSTLTVAGLERGHTEAQFLAGMAYTYGHAAQIDEAKGATLLARAAAASHREAQLQLGHAYRLGRGVERDTVEAYKWYALAAQKGSAGAKAEGASLERSLSAEELAQAQSRAALWKPATKELSPTQADR